MPTVSKQKPASAPAAVSNPNSGGDGWPARSDGIKVLLYGESGTGKTTLWATFPHPIRVLICSGGNRPGELRSVDTTENRKRIFPVHVRTVEEVGAALADAERFATVVLDHVSGLQDLTLKELLGLDELPAQKGWGLASQQQWGQSTAQCKEVLRVMLALPGNVVIVGQQRTFGGRDDGVDPEVVKPVVGVGVTPSLAGWLNPACDYVVQTFKRPRTREVESEIAGQKVTTTERLKGVEYCLRTGPHDVFMTKFRLPRGRELPEYVTDPSYAKLIALVEGRAVTTK